MNAETRSVPKALLTVGIIGCGLIVKNMHLPVLLSLSGINVAWLADRDATKAKALSSASGVDMIPVAESLSHLPKTDLLLLGIPNGVRPPYLDLIREGVTQCAYVEKPFAQSITEHDFLARDLEDWQIAVGHDRRAFGLTRLAREVVDSRIFGLLRSARFEFGGLGRILTGGGYSGNSQLAGGGILYQMGVHYIDSLLFISRAKNIAIESGVMEVEDDLDIHTDATLIITVEDDRQVPLELLVTSFRNTNYRIELEFDNATVSFVPAYGAQNLEVSHRSSTILGYLHPTPHHGPLNAHASFAAHWRGVIELVTSRSPNETSASSCRLTTQALELLYSLKNGAV